MKLSLILSILLWGGLTTVNAQRDTTKNPVEQGDPAVRQSSDEIRQNTLRDMEKISANELPAALKKTLQHADYKGQNKTFYRSKKKDEYTVEIQKGEVTSFYLFDKEGKPINSN